MRGGRHGGNQGGGNNNPHGDNQFDGANQITRVTVLTSSSDTNRQARQRARQVRRDDAARQRAVQRRQQSQAPAPTPRPAGPGKFKRALSAVRKQSMTTKSNEKYQQAKTRNAAKRRAVQRQRETRRTERERRRNQDGGSGSGE